MSEQRRNGRRERRDERLGRRLRPEALAMVIGGAFSIPDHRALAELHHFGRLPSELKV